MPKTLKYSYTIHDSVTDETEVYTTLTYLLEIYGMEDEYDKVVKAIYRKGVYNDGTFTIKRHRLYSLSHKYNQK